MFYELGLFLFRLGLAVTVMFFVMYTLAVAMGVPIPPELVNANAFTAMINKSFGGFITVTGLSVGSLVGVKAVESLSRTVFGRGIEFEIGKIQAIMIFIGLFTIAQAGIATITNLFVNYVSWAVPPLAGGVSVFNTLVNTLSTVSLSYFLMVKVFGAPTF
ncbi:MAG: hypothetical protein QXO22_04305 [Thermosphaera sp.]